MKKWVVGYELRLEVYDVNDKRFMCMIHETKESACEALDSLLEQANEGLFVKLNDQSVIRGDLITGFFIQEVEDGC